MNKSNLLDIIRKFDSHEFKEFGEFIYSPYFNKNSNVRKLYDYLKKYYPDFPEDKIEKEYVYKKLFSKSKYNDGFMRLTLHILSNLAEEFLAYENFRNDKGSKGIALLEELNSRKLEKAFLKKIKETENLIDTSSYMDADYLHYKSHLETIRHDFLNWTRFRKKNLQDYSREHLLKAMDYATTEYLIRTLTKYAFLYFKRKTEVVEFETDVADTIIHFLKNEGKRFLENPIVKIYFYQVLLQSEGKEEQYKILKEILLSEPGKYNRNHWYNLHNQLQEYCTMMSFKRDKRYFMKERFELYGIALERGLVRGGEDLYFDDVLFGSISIVALSLKEFVWLKNFIDKYKSQLAPDNSDIIVNFALAKLHFGKGEFREAMDIVNKMKSVKHIQYKIAYREMTLMLFYELSLFVQAHSFIDTQRHFLTKNEKYVSNVRLERQQNFLKLTTKLLKQKEKPNKMDLEILREEILEKKNTIQWEWLNEKIEELIN